MNMDTVHEIAIWVGIWTLNTSLTVFLVSCFCHIIPKEKNTDDRRITAFAKDMQTAMRVGRACRKGDWDNASQSYLSYMLVRALHRGRIVSVANYCMMLDWHGYKCDITEGMSRLHHDWETENDD